MGNLATPKSVQKLQMALHAKAKAEIAYPNSAGNLATTNHDCRGSPIRCAYRARAAGDVRAINPQTAAPLRLYLEAWEHGADIDGPLFRPLHHNGKRQDQRRGMDPDAIGRVVRKYATELGLDRGYPAHSMRATFITTALENGAQLDDVQTP